MIVKPSAAHSDPQTAMYSTLHIMVVFVFQPHVFHVHIDHRPSLLPGYMHKACRWVALPGNTYSQSAALHACQVRALQEE